MQFHHFRYDHIRYSGIYSVGAEDWCGAADSRQATAASPREGMPGPSTGYRPRRHCWGPCGASTPSRVAAQPRQIRQSGAKPEPGRTTGAAAWSLAVVASRVRPRRRSLSRWFLRREPERRCAVVGRWSLGDKVHRGGVHRPFAHAFSQSAGTQVANAKAVCGATSRMQTKMRVRIRTLLETA